MKIQRSINTLVLGLSLFVASAFTIPSLATAEFFMGGGTSPGYAMQNALNQCTYWIDNTLMANQEQYCGYFRRVESWACGQVGWSDNYPSAPSTGCTLLDQPAYPTASPECVGTSWASIYEGTFTCMNM